MSIFVSMGNMCVPKGSFAKPLGIRLFVPVGCGQNVDMVGKSEFSRG